MLDGFLVILIAVAIPAYLLNWYVGNKRKKKIDEEIALSREMTDLWISVLSASPEDVKHASLLASYNPEGDDVTEKYMPTPEKMAAYYFDTLGLAGDFRAIYGSGWRERVRIISDPDFDPHKQPRPSAVWRVDGFFPDETREFEKAVAAILLSREGKVMARTGSKLVLNITVVPNDRRPWANRWFRRIEENIRTAGHDVDLYVCSREYEGYKTGAFFAPGPYLEKLDEQEDAQNEI